jgi:hypothetical protein
MMATSRNKALIAAKKYLPEEGEVDKVFTEVLVSVMGGIHGGLVANSPRLKFDFALDLDRNVERQLGHANGTAGVSPDGWTEDLEDEIGEAVDDAWLPVEAGRRVHHAEDAVPGAYAIQIAEAALEAAQDSQRREARRGISLLWRDLSPDLSQRERERPIGIRRAMAGDEGFRAGDPDELERKYNASWRLQWLGQHQTEHSESFFYLGHGSPRRLGRYHTSEIRKLHDAQRAILGRCEYHGGPSLSSAGVTPIRLPPSSPNLNAYAERSCVLW